MDRIGLVRKKVDQIRPNKSEWIGVNRMDWKGLNWTEINRPDQADQIGPMCTE